MDKGCLGTDIHFLLGGFLPEEERLYGSARRGLPRISIQSAFTMVSHPSHLAGDR
jgi:hypothetical protein